MGWIASLSNGATLVEGKAVPGLRTPWQELLNYCRTQNVTITKLRLSKDSILIEAMPPKMCDGYFHAYEAMRAVFRDIERIKQGIGSIIGEQVYITWICCENGTYYIEQEVRPLSEVKIHTTLS